MSRIKTPEEVRAGFDDTGISIANWARANAFGEREVYDVLAGRLKGDRGRAHRIAVKLGLKEGRIARPETFDPAA
uniref:Phage-associated protein, BcepMu gp16 family n=1 Tax=Candidatus Kentrum sp. TC TaxID=2126339 RepID=A0A450YYH2_9GAMM|nr:MAG: phage-associated protein, BcepMu gp16 family [Candidatus Kentron sp. TC]